MMKTLAHALACLVLVTGTTVWSQVVVFQGTSPYHNVRVIDQGGYRTLSFDGSSETRMSLANPLMGHFEYIDYFHMPWLWNRDISNALMIGLGGGSIQRSYQHYYPDVVTDTVDIDPLVVEVARRFFGVREDARLNIHVQDGRQFVEEAEKEYDVVIIDAYSSNTSGSFIPAHLATREFFQLVDEKLTENGVVAYNVMGQLHGWRADLLGTLYNTMRSVFPQVYLFPARDSANVVLVATKSEEFMTPPLALERANQLALSGRARLPGFVARVRSFRNVPPAGSRYAPVLTDAMASGSPLLRR